VMCQLTPASLMSSHFSALLQRYYVRGATSELCSNSVCMIALLPCPLLCSAADTDWPVTIRYENAYPVNTRALGGNRAGHDKEAASATQTV